MVCIRNPQESSKQFNIQNLSRCHNIVFGVHLKLCPGDYWIFRFFSQINLFGKVSPFVIRSQLCEFNHTYAIWLYFILFLFMFFNSQVRTRLLSEIDIVTLVDNRWRHGATIAGFGTCRLKTGSICVNSTLNSCPFTSQERVLWRQSDSGAAVTVDGDAWGSPSWVALVLPPDDVQPSRPIQMSCEHIKLFCTKNRLGKTGHSCSLLQAELPKLM